MMFIPNFNPKFYTKLVNAYYFGQIKYPKVQKFAPNSDLVGLIETSSKLKYK